MMPALAGSNPPATPQLTHAESVHALFVLGMSNPPASGMFT